MKNILLPLISTREGWVFRQLLKGIAIACASLTTWLASKGVDADATTAIVAGVGSALAWGAEFGLSKLASRIATPCLVLACLLLTSCSNGNFLGISKDGWLKTGKAALSAAVPVAIDERAKTAAKNPQNVQP